VSKYSYYQLSSQSEGETLSRLFEALRNSADGAFVIDEQLRILFWNKAAEAILGFGSDDVTGQFCYQFLRGYNEGKRLICKAKCQVANLALQSKPVPNYDIHVKTVRGDNRWLDMSVFTYRMDSSNGKKVIVHLFHDLNRREVDDRVLGQVVKAINRYHDIRHNNGTRLEYHQNPLTTREREVLSLLVDGLGTRGIAELLSISVTTVRNHIQHILQKLQVHSRLEAVAIAVKNELVN
jgi:PAS domain S-box-containing protein